MPQPSRSRSQPRRSSRQPQPSLPAQILLGFVFCVLFPGFVTAIAPVSWVQFTRSGETVTATAQTCALFCIPYRRQQVSPVIGVDDRFIQGRISNHRRREDQNRSEDEAFLQIHGEQKSVEVPVSPVNIARVVQQTSQFLEDPRSTQLKLVVVANWKFSVIAGGLLSLLTVLYVVGLVLTILQGLKRLLTLAPAAVEIQPAGSPQPPDTRELPADR